MGICPHCGDETENGEYVHAECHDEYIAYLDAQAGLTPPAELPAQDEGGPQEVAARWQERSHVVAVRGAFEALRRPPRRN